MGAQGAVSIVYRRELSEAAPEDVDSRRSELIEEYTERYCTPYMAAERGYIDDVIDPRDSRRVLIKSFAVLRSKKEQLPARKHGNMPL